MERDKLLAADALGTTAGVTPPAADTSATFSVSWRSATVVLSIGLVAAVIGLVVLVSTQRLDVLASVALIVAIIAFASQLVIFIADANSQSRQESTSRAINTETQTLLTEIRVTAKGSETFLQTRFDRMLEHFLGDLKGASDNESLAFGWPVISGKSVDVRPRSSTGTASADAFALPDPTQNPRFVTVTTYPDSDEGKELFSRVSMLSVLAIGELVRYGVDERLSAVVGTPPGIPSATDHAAPLADELKQFGFLERVDVAGRLYSRLTASGLTAASLFIPKRRVPSWLRELNRTTGHHDADPA